MGMSRVTVTGRKYHQTAKSAAFPFTNGSAMRRTTDSLHSAQGASASTQRGCQTWPQGYATKDCPTCKPPQPYAIPSAPQLHTVRRTTLSGGCCSISWWISHSSPEPRWPAARSHMAEGSAIYDVGWAKLGARVSGSRGEGVDRRSTAAVARAGAREVRDLHAQIELVLEPTYCPSVAVELCEHHSLERS